MDFNYTLHSTQDLEEFHAFEGERIKMRLKKCYETDTKHSVKVHRRMGGPINSGGHTLGRVNFGLNTCRVSHISGEVCWEFVVIGLRGPDPLELQLEALSNILDF